MKQYVVTLGSQTTSPVFPVDHRTTPFKLSIGCVISAGADLIYSIQHTFDNIWDSDITPTWFNHATLVNRIVSADGSYIAPVRAIRLNVTAWTSGSITMTVIPNGVG